MIAGNVSQEAMDEYNNSANKEFNEKGMDACPNCARTFLPDRLVVHLRSCNKAHGVVSQVPNGSSPIKSGGSGGMGSSSKSGGSP
jgi:hypothetical protein